MVQAGSRDVNDCSTELVREQIQWIGYLRRRAVASAWPVW
jgi:hypothetical protein